MPGFASDRQLTERVLIPAMMGVIVASMKRLAETNGDGDLPMLDQVQELLTEAMGEPLLDLPDDRVAKLLRRAMRLTEVAMKPNFERQLGVQYLIVAYWTRSLVERGIVSVGSESAFGLGYHGSGHGIRLGRVGADGGHRRPGRQRVGRKPGCARILRVKFGKSPTIGASTSPGPASVTTLLPNRLTLSRNNVSDTIKIGDRYYRPGGPKLVYRVVRKIEPLEEVSIVGIVEIPPSSSAGACAYLLCEIFFIEEGNTAKRELNQSLPIAFAANKLFFWPQLMNNLITQ